MDRNVVQKIDLGIVDPSTVDPYYSARFNEDCLVVHQPSTNSSKVLYSYNGSELVAFNANKATKVITTDTYLLTPSDNKAYLKFTSSNAITLTVNSDVEIPGFNFSIEQGGTGVITIDGSATINNQYNKISTIGQYSSMSFVYASGGFVNSTPLDKSQHIMIPCSDESTPLTTGVKHTFRACYDFTLTQIKVSLTTAQASGTIFTIDVKKNGTSLFTTLLTIDNTHKTSKTATTPAVLSSTSILDDDEITVEITQVGDGTATGLKLYIIGYKT